MLGKLESPSDIYEGKIAADLSQEYSSPPPPPPIKTLHLYRRIWPGKKYLFAPSSTEPAEYFIKNPVPHKHASQWRPIFYRGDNPKYCPDTTVAIARMRRTGFWNAFRVELGDGVDTVVRNAQRAFRRTWHRRMNKMRRFFGRKAKPPKTPIGEDEEVSGFVMQFWMKRTVFVTRTLTFEMEGETYRWSGTRRFLPRWSRWMKGVSHDLKLVDSRNQLVATYEKDRWEMFKGSEKTPETANKKKHYVGTLRLYPVDRVEVPTITDVSNTKEETSTEVMVDEKKKTKKKPNKNLNPEGSHTGDLTEESIVLTCWMVVEAEHRLRHKIEDILEEVGEILGD